MKKVQELREHAVDVLGTKLKELEASLFDARIQASLGKLENVSRLRILRRDIARVKTILKEKLSQTKAVA